MINLRNPFLPGLLLALVGAAHPWLEATMARHMVAELPLLFACGWLAAHAAGGPDGARWRRWRSFCPAMLLAVLLITSVWMVPVALDYAVIHVGANALKVASMLLAGFLAGVAWRNAGVILQGFFVVNWAWMTITAGLLYQDAPQQLCSVYLSDQQWTAGVGLVTLASAVLSVWLLHAVFLPALQEPGSLQGRRGDGREGS
jgi:hypothetical protein